MPFKATTIRTFIFAISIYFVGLAAFLYFQQEYLRKNQLQAIDLELRIAVSEARGEVTEKSRIDISGNTPIPVMQDFELAEKLTKIATERGLDFIYSMFMRGEKIFFSSSSQTDEEIIGQETYKYVFLSEYDEASDVVYKVFKDGTPAFDEYTDKWGNFRTFFQPVFKGDKVDYVIAADISTDKVKQFLQESFYSSLGLGLFLSLIAFPLMWLFARSVNKERDAEKIILFTDVETGLDNFTKLREDIKTQSNLKLALIEVENYNDILNAIGPAKTAHITKQLIGRVRSFIDERQYDVQLYCVDQPKFALLTTLDLSIVNTTLIKNLFKELVKTGYGVIVNNDVHLQIRIGAAANEQSLFILANMALDKAKKENKSVVFFNDANDLPKVYLDNIKQTNIFHKAIDDGRLKAFFQPIVDAKTAQIAKFECLARVVDDDGNVIQNPDEFMPIAYGSRLAHKVTRTMLDQSLQAIKGKEYCISINLAVSDLFDHATMKYICYQLDKSGQAKQIEFEILEHENIRDYNKAAGLILQLKKRGCQVGMDDLGKHYSNFDRLANLPLDFVKIDGSIVPHIEEDETALIVAKNIIDLAKSKNLTIVAEYCINEHVYNAAVILGIDYLQGFFIGTPNIDIQDIIRSHNQVKPQLIQVCPVLDHSRVV